MDFSESLQSFSTLLKESAADDAVFSDAQATRLIAQSGILPSSAFLRSKILSAQQRDNSSLEDVVLALSGDPILCLRLIALCNQSYYARGGSISSVEAAVNHLGLLKMAEIVDQLSVKGSYDAALRGRALTQSVIQEVVLAGCIARSFFPLFQKNGDTLTIELERSYFLGCCASLWRVIFAHSKPNQYSSLMLELLADDGLNFERQIRKVFKKTVPELGADVMREMGLPDNFSRLIDSFSIPPWNRRSWAVPTNEFTHAHVAAGYTAGRVAHELSLFRGGNSLKTLLRDIAQKCGVQEEDVYMRLRGLRARLCERLQYLELTPFRIPDYIAQFNLPETDAEAREEAEFVWPKISKRLEPFLLSLKASFKASSDVEASSRFSQAIYTTLLALLRGMNFDRAVFMRYDDEQKALVPLVLLGRPVDYIKDFVRFPSSTGNTHMPDAQAFLQQRPVFQGDPVFGDDWPFAAFPVIWRGSSEGIFYADKASSDDLVGLSTDEQVALIALAEEWQHVPDDFH